MPAYKLVYFDVRGRAELSRCVLAAAGVEYEDVRLTSEEWEAYKSKTAFGQLPELSVDGKVLAQSNSIARFLAKEYNLAGKTNWEQAEVDQYMELANDYIEKVYKQIFETEEAKKEAEGKKIAEEVTPQFMEYFEKSLTKNGGGYLVGSSLTVADLAVQNVFDTIMQNDSSAMDKFPKLKKNRDTIRAAKNIGNYLEKRKQTDI